MRLFYQAKGFAIGKTITAFFIKPDLTKSEIMTFIELSDGLYYLDVDLVEFGPHCGKFFENGKATIAKVFRKGEHPGLVTYNVR